ncbi:hypothetical protein [Cutibacterium acnes]|uniref:hypothetical protein n=1 Tax=Cutibacterium acnes TaxID=1747 RepID=UPI000BFD778B|nr:hypothetical protein [Cutibacterium acnes]MCY0870788.1 hypothetical protein [Bacillota bacterium]PGF24171.1 hypothetical protein B1B08_12630 [Cutibacterium acnes subsp. defendens]TLG53185.1 hypothetical protein FD538_12270 [Cutibacterium acnes]TMT70232.1 hypothetical protein DMX85_12315 [Cutibacterium acnes]
MSTIVLTSVSGAPGVTTTAIGLGRVWPQSSLVVEDDTHHAMLAGYLRAAQHAEPNLATVANLTATPTNAQTVWESIARPLPTDDPVSGLRRKAVLGPPTPWSRAGIDPRWGFMLALWRQLAEAGIDTIIDLGRLATPLTSTPHLIATPIIDDADMILVMIEATLRDVAGAHTMIEGLAEQMNLAGAHQRLGLLVHRGGAARGVAEFTDKEITSALQLPVCGSIVHDPVAAAQLSDGVGQRFDKSRLARSLSKVAGVLVDVIGRRRADSKEDL